MPTTTDAASQAASLRPGDAATLIRLGNLCLRAGRLAEAVSAFDAALATNPRLPQACLGLGMALQAQGESPTALAAYRRATVLLPSLAEARFREGALLETLGRRDESIAAFRRAAASAPKTSLGRLARARMRLAEDRDEEAERALRQLLVFEPGHAAANDLLGTVLANSGRFAEARACYERAITAAPELAGSFYDLVRCQLITSQDGELLARMRAAAGSAGLHAEALLKIHLALGKAADDLDDPAQAMRHFDTACALRDGLCRFDAGEIEARVDRLIAAFTPERAARAAERGLKSGQDGARALLIVGLPRSGTTLVEQILSCHPDVHAGGEMAFWTERGGLWDSRGPDDAFFLDRAASDYATLLRACAPNSLRVTDKMPLNIFWAGLVHEALPGATIIHCRRSPIDTALSIHRTYFNQHVAFPTGGRALVAAIRAVARLAAHWRAVLPANRFVELDYEELVRHPEPDIRRLIAASGVAWDDACLHPECHARSIKTPSKWQVRQPISPAAAGRWRRYEPWLGPLAALAPGG